MTCPGCEPVSLRSETGNISGNGTGDIAATVPLFDTYAEQTFNRSGVPGMAVAVVKDDRVVYLRCFGVRNTTSREPVTPDTRFQLASISKSFTTAGIADMVGNGELSWDDRVVTLYPDFRLSDPWVTEHATFRDLLSHRTGLPELAGDELQEIGYNRTEIIHRLRYVPLTGQFRSTYAYANIDITSAAEAAARRAGKPWEDVMEERIFIPAGMMNTSMRFADFISAEDHADTYGPESDGVPMNDDVNAPAGGVSSTISDMTRYARLQVNRGRIDDRQVVAADALEETHRPQIIRKATNTSISAYGLGWEVNADKGRILVGHGGDLSSGVSTYIQLYPEEHMAIVVLTNDFLQGHVLKNALTRGWDDLYNSGTVGRDWYGEMTEAVNAAMQPGASVSAPSAALPPAPSGAKPPVAFTSYTGLYIQDYYGSVRVESNETGLLAYLGHRAIPRYLVPYNGDVFIDTGSKTAVNFTAGSNGNVSGVLFTDLEKPGRNGTFTRIPS